MANYTDYDRDRRYGARYDRNDDRYGRYDDDRDGNRRGRYDDRMDDMEGYDREDGRTRWDYAGRGPDDNDRNYRGTDPGQYDRGDYATSRDHGDSGRDRYDGDRGRYSRYDDDRSRYGRSRGYDRDDDRAYGGRDYDDRYDGPGRSRDDMRMGTATGPMSGRGPEDYTRSSDRITEQVNERLTDDGHVDASKISVSADDGEVTLNGTVSDRSQKRRAENVAESVRGVRDVHNRLTIGRDDEDGTATRTKKTTSKASATS